MTRKVDEFLFFKGNMTSMCDVHVCLQNMLVFKYFSHQVQIGNH